MERKVKKYSGAEVKLKGYIGYLEDKGNWSSFTIYDHYEGREGEEVTARYQIACYNDAHEACMRFKKGDYVQVIGGQYPRAYIDKNGQAQVANQLKIWDGGAITIPEFQSNKPNFDEPKSTGYARNEGRRNEPAPFEDDDIPF